MNAKMHVEQPKGKSEITRGVIQRGAQVFVILLIYAAALFIPAGRLELMILRTALEDQTLQKELAGYGEYAQQVRYRLLPGVW